jgi:hypothetical protein
MFSIASITTLLHCYSCELEGMAHKHISISTEGRNINELGKRGLIELLRSFLFVGYNQHERGPALITKKIFVSIATKHEHRSHVYAGTHGTREFQFGSSSSVMAHEV